MPGERTVKGFTNFTKERGAARPSGIALQDSTGATWYLWVMQDGSLRVGTHADVSASDFDSETDGTLIGPPAA